MWTDSSFVTNKVTIQLWNNDHNLTMFRFPDIVSFNFTLTIDPQDIIPRGKGDVHSMVVAYTSCTYFGVTSEELCGPYRGTFIKLLTKNSQVTEIFNHSVLVLYISIIYSS